MEAADSTIPPAAAAAVDASARVDGTTAVALPNRCEQCMALQRCGNILHAL